MLKLFENLCRALEAGENGMLVATVEAKGSSPRSAGAYMLVTARGRVYGTIGGGNLEYQATRRAQALLERTENALEAYDLSNDTAAGLGMICGGRTKVLYRCFRADCPADLEFARKALERETARQMYWMLLPLEAGKPQIRQNLSGARRQFGYAEQGARYYAEQFHFDGKVYLFGGGHLSQELEPLLNHVGFSCVVLDDRAEFADPALFPGAQAVRRVDFAALREPVTAEDYIVIATRGHLADTDCIRFALRTQAKYIGVVGSRKKVKFVRETMLAEGFEEDDLNRLTTPIGLPIGSETPAEIAVSIAAQLIQVRAGK